MPLFSNTELVDMVLIYGEVGGNAVRAKELYRERFPNRRIPDSRTFSNTVQHLRDHGSFKLQTQDRGRARTGRILNVEPQILDAVEAEPSISTRRLALRFDVSQFTIWRTLNEQGLHPYHVQRVQALQPGDPLRRQVYCRWILNKVNQQRNFLMHLLSTDEAGFTREGIFNSRNTHIWSDENPHAFRENHFQEKFSLNVWAGIVGDRLVGPFILPPRLNGIEYLQFLNNTLDELLEDVPLAVRRDMWFLHDGAPAHYFGEVRTWLDNNFPEKWIGRNGPVLWPARSPDLNPCDFFLWGHMKQLVYSTPVHTQEELRARVENAAEAIRNNRDMLSRVRDSITRRAQACLNNNGMHFEQLL